MNMVKKKTNRFCLTVILGFITYLSGAAQGNSVKYDLNSLNEKKMLEVFNRTLSTFSEDDKNGVRFSKHENDGVAWLKHVIFTNGVIELDIRGKDELQQSFVGIAFHGIDTATFDAVYFRPFNFQSSDPVRKIHAVQYIAMPDFPWDVLREKFNGKYEKAVNPAPGANDWFHVKVIVRDSQIRVFVNGNQEPCLSVEKLNNRSTGKIGLWVGNNSDGDFANLQISTED
jgi:hypothetical protein